MAVAAGGGSRPVFLFLTGGPGQGGIGFVPSVQKSLGPLLKRYRLVMLDQRGTGEDALRCPALQAAVGGSDLLTPPPSAVRECAKAIGPERRAYTTTDTVADLEMLRQALGVDEWVVDGVSYGTYVAQRYAIAYPDRVRALVLDSVVPPDRFDPFLRANLRRAAFALRDACGTTACPGDPAEDLAWVVQHGTDGVGVLNALTIQSIFDPTFHEVADVPELLQAARLGDAGPLDQLLDESREWGAFPASELSAGLHLAALCADIRFPWGTAEAPLEGRSSALRRAAARIPARALWPFDRRTAIGHGVIQSCLHYPPVPIDEPRIEHPLPDVPVLLLNGERDLSTPVAWARQAASAWPNDRLVVIPDDGHSVQTGDADASVTRTVVHFLFDEL